MSSILDKAFDATKKVVRTIFKGSPNLFTAPDLNRQIEGFKYQMDMAQRFLPIVGNITITASNTATQGGQTYSLSVSATGSVKAAGAEFSGITAYSGNAGVTNNNYRLYVVIRADKTELTFSDDPTHTLVGAKFADGTVKAAANQIVYSNVRFDALAPNAAALVGDDIVAIVALVHFDRTGDVLTTNVIKNYASKPLPMFSAESETIRKSIYSGIGGVIDGMTVSEAIYRLQNLAIHNKGLVDQMLPATEHTGDLYVHGDGGIKVGTYKAYKVNKLVFVEFIIPNGADVGKFIKYQHNGSWSYPKGLDDVFPFPRVASGETDTVPVQIEMFGTVGSYTLVSKDFSNDWCARFIPAYTEDPIGPTSKGIKIHGYGNNNQYAHADAIAQDFSNVSASLCGHFWYRIHEE